MITKNREFVTWLTITIIWMVLIFIKSAQSYTDQDIRPLLASLFSADISNKWIPHLEFHYDKDFITWTKPYDYLEFFIRKAAHIIEYALLCLLWIKTLIKIPLSIRKAFLFSGIICFLYACSDEWHQTFIQGRTGHFIDVMVDSVGMLIAIIIYSIIIIISNRLQKNLSGIRQV